MRCLLLQGPVGPLFSDLQAHLQAQGHKTLRVVIDGGDLWFSGKGPIAYWSGQTEWTTWLAQTLTTFKPDIIYLFGAERPAHKIARSLAKERGIKTLCLEEGYLRPGFMTAEWDGNNHDSPLHTAPIKSGPQPIAAKVRPGMLPIIGWSTLYYTARVLFSLPKQWPLYHRQYAWPLEVARWAQNFAKSVIAKPHDSRTRKKLATLTYDLIALQVPGDSSLVTGGDGWTTERLLDTAMASFAAHAPSDRHLAIKIHPLARGHGQDARIATTMAKKHGIENRVHLIHGGPLACLLDKARSLITISSTSALSSIDKHKPTLVLGKGIARRKEIAHCGPNEKVLDSFWTSTWIPDAETKAAFWHTLGTSLIPGDAYRPEGRIEAVKALADMLEQPKPLPRTQTATNTAFTPFPLSYAGTP